MLKIVLLGDMESGKTALLERFCDAQFSSQYISTRSATQKDATINLSGKQTSQKLQIWELPIPGKSDPTLEYQIHLPNASAILICFDITFRKSYNNLPALIKMALEQAPSSLIYLVATKSDLAEDRKVTEEELQAFAEANKCKLFVTSAKKGEGVEKLFEAVAQDCAEKEAKKPPKNDQIIDSYITLTQIKVASAIQKIRSRLDNIIKIDIEIISNDKDKPDEISTQYLLAFEAAQAYAKTLREELEKYNDPTEVKRIDKETAKLERFLHKLNEVAVQYKKTKTAVNSHVEAVSVYTINGNGKEQRTRIKNLREIADKERKILTQKIIELERISMSLPQKIIHAVTVFIGGIIGGAVLGGLGFFGGMVIGTAAGLPTGPGVIGTGTLGGVIGGAVGITGGIALGGALAHREIMASIRNYNNWWAQEKTNNPTRKEPNYWNYLASSFPAAKQAEIKDGKQEEPSATVPQPTTTFAHVTANMSFFASRATEYCSDTSRKIMNDEENKKVGLVEKLGIVHRFAR